NLISYHWSRGISREKELTSTLYIQYTGFSSKEWETESSDNKKIKKSNFQPVYEENPAEQICSDRPSGKWQVHIRFQARRDSRYSGPPPGQAYVRTGRKKEG